MTSTWVVGVDGSDNSHRAAEWAVGQAVGRDVRIILVSTWMAPIVTTEALFGSVMMPDWSEFEAALQRLTAATMADLARDGVAIEARIAQGPSAHTLIELSRDADLLVVGGRGLGRAKGLVLGSVSQRCASNSVVPTAIIGMEAPVGPAVRILVGYDGSMNARTAATWALEFAQPDAEITILDALPIAPWLAADVVRDRFPEEVSAAETEFADHMAELDPDNRATHSFVIADARIALLDASQSADLLILGARGRGKLGAMLLGSTTTWLLHDATRATIVIPPTDRSRD